MEEETLVYQMNKSKIFITYYHSYSNLPQSRYIVQEYLGIHGLIGCTYVY